MAVPAAVAVLYLVLHAVFAAQAERQGLITPSGDVRLGFVVLGLVVLALRMVVLFVLPPVVVYGVASRLLDRAARRLHVPRVLAVSSISGTLGGLGLLGYATSHNLLDAYAASSSDELCRWTSIAWDAWDFYKEDRSADARDVGIDALAISEQEGLEALRAVQGAAWPER